MPVIKLSCEFCKKNHTCKGATLEQKIEEVYVYKKTRAQARKEKIERTKPIIKKQKFEFNVMN